LLLLILNSNNARLGITVAPHVLSASALPTRFERSGIRHYRAGDDPNRAYASVTAILGATSSAASKKALANWAERNPGGREAAAARGSAVHLACENYIRGLPTQIPDEYRPYWDGLAKYLDQYDTFLWSERPLRPEWLHCVGEDGISRIWSHMHGYAGCPDLVGLRNGVAILCDFKTSVGPYARYFPKTEEAGTFGGWQKYMKCAIQLGAYSIALEETLGITIDAAQILVSTPETDQSFLIHGDELLRHRIKWLQRVRQFYELKAAEAEAEAEAALIAA